MVVIAESFKKENNNETSAPTKSSAQSDAIAKRLEETDASSQDITLSVVREPALDKQVKEASKPKRSTKSKRKPQRGVPMREKFVSEVGGTQSFISGPADPLHNPYMA